MYVIEDHLKIDIVDPEGGGVGMGGGRGGGCLPFLVFLCNDSYSSDLVCAASARAKFCQFLSENYVRFISHSRNSILLHYFYQLLIVV